MTTTEGGPGRSEASTGQREAARAHVTQLRQDGGTYRSIAAAAALSPAPSTAWPPAAGEHNPAPQPPSSP